MHTRTHARTHTRRGYYTHGRPDSLPFPLDEHCVWRQGGRVVGARACARACARSASNDEGPGPGGGRDQARHQVRDKDDGNANEDCGGLFKGEGGVEGGGGGIG